MTINYSKQVLLKRGNTAVSSTYTGPLGEVTYDTDLHQIRVHDGERAGGWIVPGGPEYDLLVPLIGNAAAQQDQINSLFANANVQQAFMESIVNQGNVDPGTGNETFWFNTEDGRLYIKQADVWVDSNPTELPNPSYVTGIMGDFAGNIVPAANVTYSLGTQEAQWKDLWVSNNTIYIGNTPISVQNGTLLVNGNAVSGGGNLGKFVFGSDGDSAFIHTTDDAGDLDGYDIVLIPGGEGESSITIPKQANALAGDPLVISATAANSSVAIETSSGTFSFSNLGLTFPQGSIFGTGNDDGEFVLDTWGNKPFSIYTYGGPDTHRWKFGIDGNLTLPTALFDVSGSPIVGPTIHFPVTHFPSPVAGGSLGTVAMGTGGSFIGMALTANEYSWNFGSDGNLILPTGGNILNSDNSVYGTPAGNTGEIQFNSNGVFGADSTLRYVDNGGEMTLYAEYLNAPGIFTNNIYAGDGSPGNLILSTRYGTNWKFGADGNLTLPTGGNILNSDNSVYGGGTTLPTDASGALVNDGSGGLSWVPLPSETYFGTINRTDVVISKYLITSVDTGTNTFVVAGNAVSDTFAYQINIDTQSITYTLAKLQPATHLNGETTVYIDDIDDTVNPAWVGHYMRCVTRNLQPTNIGFSEAFTLSENNVVGLKPLNTGNIGFVTDFIYNGYGITVENASVVPALGATAALIIPANGDTVLPLRLQNNLGNVAIVAGTDIDHLQSWIFNNTGTTTLPGKLWAKASDSGSIAFTNNGTDEHGYIKVDAGYNMIVNAESNFSVKRNGTDRLAIESDYTTIRSVTAARIETNIAGISRTYTFGETGILGLPYSNYLESTPANNLNLGAWNNISIIANAQSNSTTSWTFGADGTFTGPNNKLTTKQVNIVSSDTSDSGAGYAGIFKLTNNNNGATNINKSFRISNSGNLQIVDSGYANTIFDLNDAGDLRLGGNLLLSSGKEIKSAAGVGNVTIEANDGVSRVWTFKSIATLNLPSFGATPGSGDGAVGDICRDGDVLYFKTSTGWKTVGLTP